MDNPTLRVASVAHDSIVDGPGLRYVIFFQGCPHRCPGCHNPGTHDPMGGQTLSLQDILADIDRNPLLTGVTFSGGEPFLQAENVRLLAEEVVSRGKSLWIYTGYLWHELVSDPRTRPLLTLAAVLVDGPFVLARKNLLLPFRGSDNQRLIDVPASLAAGKVLCISA